MNIRTAVPEDYEEAMAFYDSMCEELGKKSFLHAGNQGGYPSEEMVKSAIEIENSLLEQKKEESWLP